MIRGSTYSFPMDTGWLTVMLVGDVIIAYRPDRGVRVHHVTEESPTVVPTAAVHQSFSYSFGTLDSGETCLRVGRIRHPTDTIIGFYDDFWRDDFVWGYAWHVDHPERSHWVRAEYLADATDPEDRPEPSRLVRLADDLSGIAGYVERVNPRAIAVAAVVEGYAPDEVAASMATFRSWLGAYQAALEERPVIEEAQS